MPTELKRRHHTVWRAYLEAWASSGALHVGRRDGTTFPTSPANASVKKHFYTVCSMTPEDGLALRHIVGLMAPERKGVMLPLAEALYSVSQTRRRLDAGEVPHQSSGDLQSDRHYCMNTIEDLHATIEDASKPTLNAILSGDFDAIDNTEGFYHFVRYVTHQYFRTAGMRLRIQKMLGEHLQASDSNTVCDAVCVLLAEDTAASICMDTSRLDLRCYRASEGARFTTSDQPVVSFAKTSAPNDHVHLYYPLSPHVAFELSNDGARNLWVGPTRASDIATLNAAHASFAHQDVYASRVKDFPEGWGPYDNRVKRP